MSRDTMVDVDQVLKRSPNHKWQDIKVILEELNYKNVEEDEVKEIFRSFPHDTQALAIQFGTSHPMFVSSAYDYIQASLKRTLTNDPKGTAMKFTKDEVTKELNGVLDGLNELSAGSCRCFTKTPMVSMHSKECPYRKIALLRDNLSKVIRGLE